MKYLPWIHTKYVAATNLKVLNSKFRLGLGNFIIIKYIFYNYHQLFKKITLIKFEWQPPECRTGSLTYSIYANQQNLALIEYFLFQTTQRNLHFSQFYNKHLFQESPIDK